MTTAVDTEFSNTLGSGVLDLMQQLAEASQHFGSISRSSGGRGRNGGTGVPPALTEFFINHTNLLWLRDYYLEAQRRLEIFLANSNLEAGGHAHRVAHLLPGGAAAPVQEPSVNSCTHFHHHYMLYLVRQIYM